MYKKKKIIQSSKVQLGPKVVPTCVPDKFLVLVTAHLQAFVSFVLRPVLCSPFSIFVSYFLFYFDSCVSLVLFLVLLPISFRSVWALRVSLLSVTFFHPHDSLPVAWVPLYLPYGLLIHPYSRCFLSYRACFWVLLSNTPQQCAYSADCDTPTFKYRFSGFSDWTIISQRLLFLWEVRPKHIVIVGQGGPFLNFTHSAAF